MSRLKKLPEKNRITISVKAAILFWHPRRVTRTAAAGGGGRQSAVGRKYRASRRAPSERCDNISDGRTHNQPLGDKPGSFVKQNTMQKQRFNGLRQLLS